VRGAEHYGYWLGTRYPVVTADLVSRASPVPPRTPRDLRVPGFLPAEPQPLPRGGPTSAPYARSA
jgi:hypothetical protein